MGSFVDSTNYYVLNKSIESTNACVNEDTVNTNLTNKSIVHCEPTLPRINNNSNIETNHFKPVHKIIGAHNHLNNLSKKTIFDLKALEPIEIELNANNVNFTGIPSTSADEIISFPKPQQTVHKSLERSKTECQHSIVLKNKQLSRSASTRTNVKTVHSVDPTANSFSSTTPRTIASVFHQKSPLKLEEHLKPRSRANAANEGHFQPQEEGRLEPKFILFSKPALQSSKSCNTHCKKFYNTLEPQPSNTCETSHPKPPRARRLHRPLPALPSSLITTFPSRIPSPSRNNSPNRSPSKKLNSSFQTKFNPSSPVSFTSFEFQKETDIQSSFSNEESIVCNKSEEDPEFCKSKLQRQIPNLDLSIFTKPLFSTLLESEEKNYQEPVTPTSYLKTEQISLQTLEIDISNIAMETPKGLPGYIFGKKFQSPSVASSTSNLSSIHTSIEFSSGDVFKDGLTERTRVFSAPGKVILSGEHAVVYGKVAVASAINLRTWCCITPLLSESSEELKSPGGRPLCGPILEFNLPVADTRLSSRRWFIEEVESVFALYLEQEFLSLEEEVAFFIRTLVPLPDSLPPKSAEKISLPYIIFHFILFRVLKIGKENKLKDSNNTQSEESVRYPAIKPYSFSVHTELPIQSGLGSSASFCVVLAKALSAAVGIKYTNDDINNIAFNAEMVIHGKCSGVDNMLCCYGGSLKYERGKMHSLTLPEVDIMIINTRITRSTKEVVNDVRVLKERYGDVVDPILESIGSIGSKYFSIANAYNSLLKSCSLLPGNAGHHSENHIADENFSISDNASEASILDNVQTLAGLQKDFALVLSDLFPINQLLLRSLGVSNSEVDTKIDALQSLGLSAKIAGAGRGGCLVAVFNERDISEYHNRRKRNESESPTHKRSHSSSRGILSPVEGFMPTFVLDNGRSGNKGRGARKNSPLRNIVNPSASSDSLGNHHRTNSTISNTNNETTDLDTSCNSIERQAKTMEGFNDTALLLQQQHEFGRALKDNQLISIDDKTQNQYPVTRKTSAEFEIAEADEEDIERVEDPNKESFLPFIRESDRLNELIDIRNELCEEGVFQEDDIWIATLGCEGIREDDVETLLSIAPERFRYGHFV